MVSHKGCNLQKRSSSPILSYHGSQVVHTCPVTTSVFPNRNSLPRRSKPMPPSQDPPSEDPPSEDAYAADREDTEEGEEEEDTDDEMWNWDPRPNITNQLSEGRSAEPLLPDDVQRASRGRSSYESVGGEVEQRERRRHEMRSRSPASTSMRLVKLKEGYRWIEADNVR